MSSTKYKIILWDMSLSRTFQDQPEKENGYPREQKLSLLEEGSGT